MSPQAVALGWLGFVAGMAGLVIYILVALRRPEASRLLNGSGLLLTSLALLQARVLVEVSVGAPAFAVQASVLLLVLSVIAQSAAALRNRRAWDGVERRNSGERRGSGERRSGRTLGEERA